MPAMGDRSVRGWGYMDWFLQVMTEVVMSVSCARLLSIFFTFVTYSNLFIMCPWEGLMLAVAVPMFGFWGIIM